MTFLPVVERELRAAARRPATYWTRFSASLAAFGVATYVMFVINTLNYSPQNGFFLFYAVAGPVGLSALLTGITLSSDSISREKREGTLGLLFLTDLKGYDVVGGKLISGMIASFYAAMATIPLMSFAIILGGVTLAEVFRMGLAVLNVLFFSHATSLMASTMATEERQTVPFSCFIIITLALILPGIAGGIGNDHPLFHFIFVRCCPAMPMLGSSTISPLHHYFWASLTVSHLLAWSFLALAIWRTPRIWQEKAAGKKISLKDRWQQWNYGTGLDRKLWRLRLLEINPFCWLVNRSRWGARFMHGLFLGIPLLILTAYGMLAWFGESVSLFGALAASTFILQMILKFSVFGSAFNFIRTQKHNGGLELLFSCTPLKTEDIVKGCWESMRFLFLPAGVILVVIEIAFFIVAVISYRALEQTFPAWGLLATSLLLPLDLFAFGWIGLWNGITSRKQRYANNNAFFFLVLVGPGAITGVLMGGISIFFPNISIPDPLLLVVWFVLSIGSNLLWGRYARRQIHTRFRQLATLPEEEQIGLLGHLGRWLGKLFARS